MRAALPLAVALLASCTYARSLGGNPACADQQDNDGDGLIDFPDDLGCTDPGADTEDGLIQPRCSDHRDNDHDGFIDHPDDPGCAQPAHDDEADDCPDGPSCPMCSNKLDDDDSGAADFPDDPGCLSAGDDFELLEDPGACGGTLTVAPLPATGIVTGTLSSASVLDLATPCGGGNGAPAAAFVMILAEPKIVVITTPDSTPDTVIDLRARPCMGASTSFECSADDSASGVSAKIERLLPADVYYIIVTGHDSSQVGDYTLKVEKVNGEGEPCGQQVDCASGLVCRIPVGGTHQICARPVCKDGLDDDGDGKIDYPTDPGCASPENDTEDDDCPDGPSCPDCSDGDDNDGDGDIDYPFDGSCLAAGNPSELCTTSEPIVQITMETTHGDTTHTENDYDPTCNSATGNANDLLYRLDLPAMQLLTLDLVAGFDTVHALLDSTCGGAPIACRDTPGMIVRNLAAGTYYVAVDGRTTGEGPFDIRTRGTIAPGGSCEGLLYQNGAIVCTAGYSCAGPLGTRTCRTQCSDGLDNNGDGKIDHPYDPGCANFADTTETTVCPGEMCPACSDSFDNDVDGKTDWPMDPTCSAAGAPSESCVSKLVGVITVPNIHDTTAGHINYYKPICSLSSTHTAPDVAWRLHLPAMQSLSIRLQGFDGAHSLLDSQCSAIPIACSDPFQMTVNNVAAGTYHVVVDGWGSGAGPYTLTTTGVIAPDGSCENLMFSSGAFTCSAGTICVGPEGARTCQ